MLFPSFLSHCLVIASTGSGSSLEVFGRVFSDPQPVK